VERFSQVKNAQTISPSQRTASQANKWMLTLEKNPTENSLPEHPFEPSHADGFIESRALFGARKEVAIEHDGAVYLLKITKQNKLILNK